MAVVPTPTVVVHWCLGLQRALPLERSARLASTGTLYYSSLFTYKSRNPRGQPSCSNAI